jgi:hypothetical protein
LIVARGWPGLAAKASRRRGIPVVSRHPGIKRKGLAVSWLTHCRNRLVAALDDPFAQLTGPLASTTRLDFEVVDSARLTPHMQRLRLTAPQLDGFGYLPGQDVMLLVAAEGKPPGTAALHDPAARRGRAAAHARHRAARRRSRRALGAVGPVRRQDRGHRAAREDHHVGHGRLAPVHRR